MFSRPNRYLLTFIACFGFCLFAAIGLSPRAQAASDPITVTSQTDTVTFPKQIDFQMSATDSAAPITEASIYISYNGVASNATRKVQIANFANTETLQWQEDISGSNFVEPGTQVSYYWQLVDNLQNTHTQAPQTFTVIDTRFSWQHLTHGQVQVNWYNRTIVSSASTVIWVVACSTRSMSGSIRTTTIFTARSHPVPMNGSEVWLFQTSIKHRSLSKQPPIRR